LYHGTYGTSGTVGTLLASKMPEKYPKTPFLGYKNDPNKLVLVVFRFKKRQNRP
jgi:hypothetical protein